MLSSQHLVWEAHVRVLDILSHHLVGKIVDVVQSAATLWFHDDNIVTLFPLDYLELHFKQSDNIMIICGKYKDHHGHMCSLVDNSLLHSQDMNVIIILNQTQELVCCGFLMFHDLIPVVPGHHPKSLCCF